MSNWFSVSSENHDIVGNRRTQNNYLKQGVKDCQTFENHVGLTDMNPMIECSINRFAVLTVDNNETKSCICTETNVTCTKTDLKHPKGELKVKRSDSFDGPPLSAHSGDKYVRKSRRANMTIFYLDLSTY